MADNENAVTVSERAVRLELQGALTKREMFAMAAMQGILSTGVDYTLYSDDDVSSIALKHADALLSELDKLRK